MAQNESGQGPGVTIPSAGARRGLTLFPQLGRDFTRLWSATVVSDLGDGLRMAALPLLAARITGDPMAVAGVSIASGLPWLLLSLLGGTLVDRMNRRTVMVRVQLVRTVIVMAFTLWALSGPPPIVVLYVLVFTLTTCEVLFSSAAPSMLPKLVGKDLLPQANARMFGGQIAAKEMAGPPLGGVLVALAIAAPFAVDSLSYLGGALLLLGVTGDFRPEAAPGARSTVWADARAGLHWVWHQSFIRTIIIGFGMANLTRAMTTSIFVLFCTRLLHVSGWGYGVLWSTAAIGALLGSVLVGRLRTRANDATLVVTAMLLHGVATASIGLARDPYVAGAASALFGFATMVWNIIGISAQQKVIPDSLMGRVMSVDQLVTWGTIPLGGLLGGLLAGPFGLRVPIVAGGSLMILTVLLIGRPLYRTMRALDTADGEADVAVAAEGGAA